MHSNPKLTALIKGRTIAGTSSSGNVMTINFTDGSVMTVQTAGNVNSGMTGHTVQAVRQQDTTLALDFEGGTSLQIQTAEATSSVMVRGKDHKFEYSD